MRVLMVCLGNICRSPMAEGWLRHKAQELNLPIEIDSAGTANYHIGKQPDTRMINYAKEYGVTISDLRGRQFTVADFDGFDRIFVMDKSNYEHVIRIARNEADKQKVSLYLNELYPNENREVPDPYYGGETDFKEVIELLAESTDSLIQNYLQTISPVQKNAQ